MSTNITLRLDEKTIDRIKHLAVEQHTSVSAWVGKLVTQTVEELDGYEPAHRRALRAMARPIQVSNADVLNREQAHER